MFVIISSLRKLNLPVIEDSGIRICSRKGAKTPSPEEMSFRPQGEIFLDPSHSLGMTGIGSLPLRLGAFAGDNSAFGCGCSPTGEPLFPS
jgi:hypothetical protein